MAVVTACVFVTLVCLAKTTLATISIDGRFIKVNGSRFFGRGVAYGSTPRGQWPDSKDSSMAWDWPSEPGIRVRDLPLLEDMNVNLLRLYKWRATHPHTSFLNSCHLRGIMVLVEVPWDWSQYDSGPAGQATMKDTLTAIVNSTSSHPAVLGYMIGNELNLGRGYNTSVWSFVAELKTLIHTVESQWHPVCSPLADGNGILDIVQHQNSAVDIHCVQLYRGRTFGQFWIDYSSRSTLPVLITEMGIDSYATGQSLAVGEQLQQQWLLDMWHELEGYAETISNGGVLFQWSDGWFKCGTSNSYSIDAHDTCSSSAGGAQPDGYANAEWYGIMAVANTVKASDYVDTLRAKPVYCSFRSLWNGTSRGVSSTSSVCSTAVAPRVRGTCTQDSTISSASPTTQYGSQATLDVSGTKSLLVLFDLAALVFDALRRATSLGNRANVMINSSHISVGALQALGSSSASISARLLDAAEIVLYVQHADTAIVAHNVSFDFAVPPASAGAGWNESSVTYQTRPVGTSIATGTAVREAHSSIVRFDVLDGVRAVFSSLVPGGTASSVMIPWSSDARMTVHMQLTSGSNLIAFHSRNSGLSSSDLAGHTFHPALEVAFVTDVGLDVGDVSFPTAPPTPAPGPTPPSSPASSLVAPHSSSLWLCVLTTVLAWLVDV